MKNIILIGFMCTGKDAAGKLLAERLNLQFIDTDQLIEKKENRKIPEIFAQAGEDYFRNIESEVLNSLTRVKDSVISTGGGIILREQNRKCLKEIGRVVLLAARPEVINSRLKNLTDRPLLDIADEAERKQKIELMLKARNKFYKETADFNIDTSDLTVEEVVDKIFSIYE